MATFRNGLSNIGIIVAVVIVIAAIGIGVYFTSDVYRTKVNAAADQFAHWTPENIAKDPVNYLNFCETQTKAAVEKLKASEISVAQKLGSIEDKQKDAKEKIAIGTKALDGLKETYRKTDANSWPITWNDQKLDQNDAKLQIVRLDHDIRNRTELVAKYDSAVTQLRAQQGKIAEARDKAKDQLAKIETNREMLKVQQITDDLKNNLVAMKGVIETSVVGAASSNTGAISLDDLAAKSASTVNDNEFNKIMGGK